VGDEIGHLFVTDFATPRLEALIQQVGAEDGYRYAHCYEEIHFGFDFPAGFSVGEWQCGRVFCDAFEVRWKQMRGGWRVCLLGESQIPRWLEEAVHEVTPVLSPRRITKDQRSEQARDWRLKKFQTQLTQQILVGGYLPVKGEGQAGFFTDTRVPHQLRYPYQIPPLSRLQRQEQLMLIGVQYVSRGVVSYIRYRRLEEYEQPE